MSAFYQESERSPYAQTWWGQTVAKTFGGKFVVFDVPACPQFEIPVLLGGSLSPYGFVSGHIGYGGVYSETGLVLDPAILSVVVTSVESSLALPCLKLVLPPIADEAACAQLLAAWPERGHQTIVKILPAQCDDLFATYGGGIRTQLRRAATLGYIDTGLMSGSYLACAVALIHETQQRVGAAYRTPRGLVEAFVENRGRLRAFGAWHKGRLVSVGCFLVGEKRAGYYLNGWTPIAPGLSPNVPMLDAAFKWLSSYGVYEVDLGASHNTSIARTKQHWGTQTQTFFSLSRKDLVSNPERGAS